MDQTQHINDNDKHNNTSMIKNKYKNQATKSPKHSMDTLSVGSGDTLCTQDNTDIQSSTCYHEKFKSSTSCTHSTNTSTNSSSYLSNISSQTHHTSKSNSPAIMIESTTRTTITTHETRNSVLSITHDGDVINAPLTVLHLQNSETIDTKDVYVMANLTNNDNNNDNNNKRNKLNNDNNNNDNQQKQNKSTTTTTTIKKHEHHQTLAVPKWTTDDMESADEYDSEAHTQTDEDIIIKRVLAKCMLCILFHSKS